MEHYDWNEGWLFTPRFDPALVRPECGLELEPVRIPHTVRVLPYNYCNENEYQSPVRLPAGVFCTQRVGRPHCSAHLRSRGP